MSAPNPPTFLNLPAETQAQIVTTRAAALGRAPEVLYKDVWVVWALQHLFALPGAPTMVFKGGTSLSKVYRAIERFSEDVDVTVDYQHLNPDTDLWAPGLSNNARGRLVEQLKVTLQDWTQTQLIPHLQQAAAAETLDVRVNFNRGSSGLDATAEVTFPVLGTGAGTYLRDHVLIELGTRNPLGPSAVHRITADLADDLPTLRFPEAQVRVMDIGRTYWEKLTLIHNEVCRGHRTGRGERMSRHWYDVLQIHRGEHGAQAMATADTLRDVVEHKTVFYRSQGSAYGACLNQGWQLVPDGAALDALRVDYETMRDVMFSGPSPTFEELMAGIRELQDELNASPLSAPPSP